MSQNTNVSGTQKAPGEVTSNTWGSRTIEHGILTLWLFLQVCFELFLLLRKRSSFLTALFSTDYHLKTKSTTKVCKLCNLVLGRQHTVSLSELDCWGFSDNSPWACHCEQSFYIACLVQCYYETYCSFKTSNYEYIFDKKVWTDLNLHLNKGNDFVMGC